MAVGSPPGPENVMVEAPARISTVGHATLAVATGIAPGSAGGGAGRLKKLVIRWPNVGAEAVGAGSGAGAGAGAVATLPPKEQPAAISPSARTMTHLARSSRRHPSR